MTDALSIADPYAQLNPTEHEDYLAEVLLARTRQDIRDTALKMVEPDDFHNPVYAHLWAAARALTGNGEMITKRNLRQHVIMFGDLPVNNRTGQPHTEMLDRTLDRISAAAPPIDFGPEAMRVVRQMGQLRRIYEGAQRMQQRVLEAADPARAMTALTEELEALDKVASASTGAARVSDMIDEWEETMRTGPTAPVVPTPWEDLNQMLNGGLGGGRFYIVGGRPGDGKTNVLTNLLGGAGEIAIPGLMFSLEMSREEVLGRVVARGARMEMSEIQQYSIQDWGWRRFGEWRPSATDMPLWIDDTAGVGMPYIKTVARQYRRKHNIQVIGVDYVQLIRSENRKAVREQQVAEISRELKGLSRELDVAIVAAAQLGRGATDRPPAMSDLRESGALEADADGIFLIEHLKLEDGSPSGEIRLHVPKNRHGRTGHVDLRWAANYAEIRG